jgi:hypothetical protein
MIVVREALTLHGIVYGPGMEIPAEAWLRLPRRRDHEEMRSSLRQ